MNDTQLYNEIFELPAPWHVTHIELHKEQEEILVFIDHDLENFQWKCPKCNKVCPIYDHREPRRWRYLDTCQYMTYIIAKLPRIHCTEHNVQTISVEWSEPNSRFTSRFESFAIRVLYATKVQSQAAHLLRISASQIHDIMHRSVSRGLLRRDSNDAFQHLSMDEKSFQKGHQYVTILSDPDGKCVLEVVQNRTLEASKTLLESTLNSEQRGQVLSVSMDMWPAFESATKEVLPNAAIVYDRFHVVAYLNDAVDKTRRGEHKALTKRNDTTLSSSKYLWLKSHENLTESEKLTFFELYGLELDTANVWAFKDNMRKFYENHTKYGANLFFEQWYTAALALGNVHLTKVAKMLHSHLDGMLAYIYHRVNNGMAESLNSQIQLIKANARGFRQFTNYRIAILFFLGKLDVYPH